MVILTLITELITVSTIKSNLAPVGCVYPLVITQIDIDALHWGNLHNLTIYWISLGERVALVVVVSHTDQEDNQISIIMTLSAL